ncbi:GTPase ObgE [Clostridium grantii]|uniref:GTPase Obg n=1 Tax=Clostridium grantii DSM 8605 TaxID=1121316 RepID=A0A1M5X4F4_9CLOT|nr:GTPase ObgE [Clostridium grantii]SHH94482.1 GTP-binding protein [Clostridium grantii DSM 8605]
MFLDKAKIFVKSGDGGNGCVAFRREKYVSRGGPEGGDGGKGGSVILVADNGLTTLLDFKYKRKFVAETGVDGSRSKCSGRKGEDLLVYVPVGTVVKDDATKKIIVDLANEGDQYIIAKGGRGGRGNQHFATPTRQAPEFCEPGMPGEEREIFLELKLLADVGLLGFPNVGKSTLISAVSKARPKIANYHFTTLQPNLGVVKVEGAPAFVMADIPGIIEGASEGVGLGIEFLRHIERTRILIHVVDISGIEGRDALEDFKKINKELHNYDIKLTDRPQIIAANKSDMLFDEEVFENFKAELNKMGYDKVFKISAATKLGVEDLMKEAVELLSTIPVKQLEIDESEFFVQEEKRFTYEINIVNDVYVVSGSFVDRALLSININEPDSLRYFHKVLKNKGVLNDLVEMGIQDGDVVRLNDFEFEYM